MDLSRESSVRLRFWAKTDSFESRDTAEVLACAGECADDGDWTLLKRWVDREDDNTYRLYDFRLPDELLTDDFMVEFRSGMSNDSDWLFVDDIAFVSADPGPTPTPPPTPIPTPTRTPRPTKKPTRAPTPAPETVVVDIPGFIFNLSDSSVRAGAKVTFTVNNNHGIPHTFTLVPSAAQKGTKLVNVELAGC